MKLIDYKCRNIDDTNYMNIHESREGGSFTNIHTKAETMVDVALKYLDHNKDSFCTIPFCHTVEGAGFGADINLGDDKFGPRTKDYICKTLEDVMALEDIDFQEGRIGEVIRAAQLIKARGHEVVVNVSGPFTILNTLIDPIKVYKGFRKQEALIEAILDKIRKNVVVYVKLLSQVGVTVISYGDSSGGLNILGPKMFLKQMDMFTVKILSDFKEIFGQGGLVVLCPKISLGLITSGRGKWTYLETEGSLYKHELFKCIGKTSFVGETCIKNKNYKVKQGGVKGLVIDF